MMKYKVIQIGSEALKQIYIDDIVLAADNLDNALIL